MGNVRMEMNWWVEGGGEVGTVKMEMNWEM